MPKRALHLVAYDIRCPRRLARVLHVVKAWSTGGQRSVHECWLTAGERAALEQELAAVIDRREDSVLLIRLDTARAVRTLGIARPPRDVRFAFIG
ncbi:CRISPR-associated protein Cas2 [Benzoatithermus flavus]|uniref:CRISPR-associated endoribonuclease Cas2 n=1 Tax=Benzoatithermus flavus TaxID=3108223 RepID=A0ABU8XVQ7_9PROT